MRFCQAVGPKPQTLNPSMVPRPPQVLEARPEACCCCCRQAGSHRRMHGASIGKKRSPIACERGGQFTVARSISSSDLKTYLAKVVTELGSLRVPVATALPYAIRKTRQSKQLGWGKGRSTMRMVTCIASPCTTPARQHIQPQ